MQNKFTTEKCSLKRNQRSKNGALERSLAAQGVDRRVIEGPRQTASWELPLFTRQVSSALSGVLERPRPRQLYSRQ